MEREKSTFDLLTQRFIVNRWKTPIGQEVYERVVAAIRHSEDLKPILDPFVLEHAANVEPFDYPFYPPDAMESGEFWVLTNNDLRGIFFHDHDFSGTSSFTHQNLGYSSFAHCNLSNMDFEKSDLSFSRIQLCDLSNTVFAYSDAFDVKIIGSKLRSASFLGCHFIGIDLSGSDLRRVFFEDTQLTDVTVSYLTKFDKNIHRKWHQRTMRTEQLPDLYRSIRIAYEKARLTNSADYYLMRERVAFRRYVLWPRMHEQFSIHYITDWGKDLLASVLSGYGIRPLRTVCSGLAISFTYAVVYFIAGTPLELSGSHSDFLSALYFSFTTFATLGYGDLTYHESRDVMRLLSTSEAWFGAVFIAFFVVVFARKILRR